jgi:xanthosine utilization system XapX-like protein
LTSTPFSENFRRVEKPHVTAATVPNLLFALAVASPVKRKPNTADVLGYIGVTIRRRVVPCFRAQLSGSVVIQAYTATALQRVTARSPARGSAQCVIMLSEHG